VRQKASLDLFLSIMMPSWRNLLMAALVTCWSGGILSARAEPESFADLVSRVLPTVVSISVKGTGESTAMMRGGARNVASAVPHIMEIVGSGCIIDPSGIVVTNRHVVDGAYEIQITLEDRTTVNARLLGKGLSFDIAVLKIDVDHPLPAIQIGDSDQVRIGDRVLAIGNPLGLRGTVTSGIVSGLRRDLRGTPYDEFIQTDASINPGNSGGPLLNMKGEVIGITNQIFSDTPTSGSIGLGFAIPSNDIQFLLQQIREHGRPTPGMARAGCTDYHAGHVEFFKSSDEQRCNSCRRGP
jgi:serine protease Do